MSEKGRGFLWGLAFGVVGTWLVHAVVPGARAVGQ